MIEIGRRQFCVALGIGVTGLIAGCSSEKGETASTQSSGRSSGDPATDAPLAGALFEVRRDPG